MSSKSIAALAAAALAGAFAVPPAWAGDSPSSAAPARWTDAIKVAGHLEAGITFNPDDPKDGLNFGQLFTDRANSPLLNQLMLSVSRDLDPKNSDFDVGFKLQALYGSDARYTHFLGEFDRSLTSRNQFDIVEANITAHLPVLTAGGIDAKLGQYSTPLGAEVIDASGNFFYSHSYIFNFGLPLKHTGLLTTTHVNEALDVWAGVDTGVNTSIGKPGDDNDALAGLAGIGLTLFGGKVTVLALSHFGPENPRSVPGHNSALRALNDIVVTWKVTDHLTSTTEFNNIQDDHFHASAEGVAQYLVYAVSDQVSVGGRAEVYRDDQGFFVSSFASSTDFVNAERGLPTVGVVSGGRTTYGALTLGLNYKPLVPKAIEGFVIRPEIRYDTSLNGTTPFNAGTSGHQFTTAVDFILPF
jgi:hypothetical protein